MSNNCKYSKDVWLLHKSNYFSLGMVSSQNATLWELESKLHGNSQSHLFHVKHTALEIQFPSEQKNRHIKGRWKDAEDSAVQGKMWIMYKIYFLYLLKDWQLHKWVVVVNLFNPDAVWNNNEMTIY